MSKSESYASFRGATARAARHVRERPGIIVSFAVGCAVGVLLRLPIIPWRLGSGAGAVIGSAVGALIGASAAALIAMGISNRADRAASATVAQVLQHPLQVISALIDLTERTNPFAHDLATCTTNLKAAAERAQQRLALLGTSDRYISGNAGIALVDSTSVIKTVIRDVSSLGTLVGFVMTTGENTPFPTRADVVESFRNSKAELVEILVKLGFRA